MAMRPSLLLALSALCGVLAPAQCARGAWLNRIQPIDSDCNVSAVVQSALTLLSGRYSPATGTTAPTGAPPTYAKALDSLLVSMANAVRGGRACGGLGARAHRHAGCECNHPTSPRSLPTSTRQRLS